MNNFKRLMALMLVLVAVLSLAACGATTDTPTTTQKPAASSSSQKTDVPPASSSSVPEVAEGLTVKVVDAAGNPIVGIKVQVCKASGLCLMPKKTNEQGEVFFATEQENGCYASLKEFEGYVIDEDQKFYFEDGKFEITITIENLA